MVNYLWHPIEPLTDEDKRIDLGAIRSIYETWHASKKRLEQSSAENLKEFNRRLVRRLSIETGILERLYDLDRGTTEALVSHGFVEDLISRSSTDIEPSRLIDILRDQESAIQLVMDCVAHSRPLTKGIIHELHAILTKHEDTTTAADQFGNRHEIALLKGKFKELPNNPRRPHGEMHEYYPPAQVESEIENLLAWLSQYDQEDPVLVGAWLHHRFTQIHPYQDGNGRVARALTTSILLRANLLPLIIDRDLRIEYIGTLEAADAGDLSPLASLFARQERGAIMQALSVDTDSEISYQKSLTSAVIENLAQKFGRRREQKHAELRRVNAVAIALRTLARTKVEQELNRLSGPLAEVAQPQINVGYGGPDYGNAYWYKFEVVQSANENHKFANFAEDHYFLKASVRVGRERLIFVTSFHHVGRELSGIMEATCFAQLESYEDSEDRQYAAESFFICSVEPFVFTYKTEAGAIAGAFTQWQDAALAVAIKEFGDRL
ncbi:MAG TPA: Fic family protein [Rhizomicrobium sp.]|jgi:Fic family protein|nr:Fic family protein [Rhizomicrobium sp.]